MPASKTSILVVDDTLDSLRLLLSMLEEEGYEPRGAPSGPIALQAARTQSPDLILLDINMPEMSGFEVCRALKADAQTRDIPVLFLSAADAVMDKVKAFDVGGVDYITKPFRVEEVLARVETHLSLSRLQQALQQANEELARKNSQIEAQARRLQEIDTLKSRFFINLSHEFRSPLTLILGRLHDLQRGYYGPQSPDGLMQLAYTVADTQGLDYLIQQILDLSKIDAGVMTLQAQPCDLTALLQTLALAFASLAERRKINLRLDFSDEPVVLLGDADALVKVFTNLLSNAFKFTLSGGQITIQLEALPNQGDGNEVRVTVQDNGPGIAAEDLPHIFERFYRVGSNIGPMPQGTGIGLALSKELIERHEGRLTVESTPGRGSLFRVSLPCKKLPASGPFFQEDGAPALQPEADLFQEARVLASSLERAYGAVDEDTNTEAITGIDDRTTLLIVDDNAEIRRFVRRHFAPSYRVLEAENGVEGLRQARQALPDLILSDVLMPEMDGYTFCQIIRQDPELDFIPIILLTVQASREHRMQGLEAGIDDYVTKPFDIDELQARVENLIASRQRLRERLTHASEARGTPDPSILSEEQRFLARVRDLVEAHLDDTDFSVEKLASELALDPSTLYRRLRPLVGQSSVGYIRTVRLEHAEHLLRARAGTVSEVAYGVGFKSVAHFSTCFSKKYGMTPSAYMKASVS